MRPFAPSTTSTSITIYETLGPPEERLYGVVDDMLDDWQASYHPAFQGVRVIGHQWSPQSSEIRDFLGRNFVPHQWLNVETDETAKQLLTTTGDDVSSLPIVLLRTVLSWAILPPVRLPRSCV